MNDLLESQIQETIKQSLEGIDIRSATITCGCGWKRAAVKMYKCLYCEVWFCEHCAETHFGMTRKEHEEIKALKEGKE